MMMETLLLVFLFTHAAGTQGIYTVSKIIVQKQQTITIPCLYDQKYVSYPKYVSSGGVWVFSHSVSHSRMTVVDNQTEQVFTATLREAEVRDSGWYWCAVSMSGSDPHAYLYLQVTEAEARLRVSSQSVAGHEGGNVTILCHGASRWCKITGACFGRDGGSLERTVVHDDGGVLKVVLWRLQKEDRGWYYCSDQDSQIPVHITVIEALDITQFTTIPSYSTTPLSEESDVRRFLWLIILGAVLLITVCGAVTLIKARNMRKQRETSNLCDDINKQQLPKNTGENSEVVKISCENLYEITTGNKPNTQGNEKNNEVACEGLYETMTGNKPNNQGNVKNKGVSCEDLYETMTGNKPNNQGNVKSDEVACEDLYESMNEIKQTSQWTAADNKNIYASMTRK